MAAGVGLDVSLNRYLGSELWVSGISSPLADHRYPGAGTVGAAVNARVGGDSQAFVYGVGLSYFGKVYCPSRCMVFAAGVDEDLVGTDVLTVQSRLGYELRTHHNWFARALFTFDLGVAAREEAHIEAGSDYYYDSRESPLVFSHLGGVLTVGYAFQISRTK